MSANYYFNSDPMAVIGISFCIRVPNVIQIGQPVAQ